MSTYQENLYLSVHTEVNAWHRRHIQEMHAAAPVLPIAFIHGQALEAAEKEGLLAESIGSCVNHTPEPGQIDSI
jgi:hypothetical protein